MEHVEFRGQSWSVADAQYDEAPGDVGSHWHLTLTNPQPAGLLRPDTPSAARQRIHHEGYARTPWQVWSCKACGPSPQSSGNWCALGCGSDYNEMTLLDGWASAPKGE